MTNKQLARLAGALAVALVLWGAFAFARRAGADHAAGFRLPAIDTAAVDTIAISKGADTALLARQPDGHWRVNGFAAAESNVDQLLRALRDTSNRSELAADRRSSDAAMGVSADSGRRVRVVVKGGTGLDLIAGHNTNDYLGVYVRPAGDSAVYALRGSLPSAMDRPLDDWRDKTVADVPPDSVQRVEVTRGRVTYALVRTGKRWHLATGAAADSGAVARLLAQYHPASAIGFAKGAQADSANFTRPTARVRVFTGGPNPAVDVAFDSTKDDLYARTQRGGTVYLLENWTLTQMAPTARSVEAATPKAR
ncbi:MAG: DUF4340 domain-containing protein [Gemmatimonadota bacterium]|nr:DUF4340 domain-containing protein [Gemmatimonadota bacterium]